MPLLVCASKLTTGFIDASEHFRAVVNNDRERKTLINFGTHVYPIGDPFEAKLAPEWLSYDKATNITFIR